MIGNPLIFLGAAIIPMLVGSIWYGPLFGKAWMSTNGFTEEDLKGSNMLLILGLSFLLSVILAAGISGLTVHQSAIAQLFAMHPDFETAGTEVKRRLLDSKDLERYHLENLENLLEMIFD